MGANNWGCVGIPQHLPPPHAIWSHGDNPVGYICHFPSRGMRRPQEAQVWHGLSPPSTSWGGGGGEEIQVSGSMGPSLSSPSPLTGWGGKKLTLLINTREDWPYTFVQLCKDSWHVPLCNARHLSIMVDSAPSRSACRCHSHLEVCKIL